ncbi:MAG TPA: maleylpyruvate isomerase family mycothiol-dependent enzyme [Acidimicrobiales bacterium]|jgi:uncharacterized protein (TIGR03086 family)|nr:maleylpyruvate isomerase family mycothiol-dependent enzyme [Acidimicrobiales bacterium]
MTAGEPGDQIADRHLLICRRFGDVVMAANGDWHAPSPCTDWDARDVLEHVIGFHDVLLLRPLGAKPRRPKDDPQRRWVVTMDALHSLLTRPGLLSGSVEVPAIGNNAPTRIDAAPLLQLLSLDVLVHTWDLARAVGAEDRLEPELCVLFLGQLPTDPAALVASGMYGPPRKAPAHGDAQSVLLARLGRDPEWQRSTPRPEQEGPSEVSGSARSVGPGDGRPR